jgi:hypothetical protein
MVVWGEPSLEGRPTSCSVPLFPLFVRAHLVAALRIVSIYRIISFFRIRVIPWISSYPPTFFP